MTDERLLTEARRLGGIIAANPVVQAYQDLARQLELDVAARQLLEQFEQGMEALAVMEATGQPIALADKQQMQSLQQSVALHPLLKKLIAAQTQYMQLMRQVQEAINAGINGGPAITLQPGDAAGDASGPLQAGARNPAGRPGAPSRLIIPG